MLPGMSGMFASSTAGVTTPSFLGNSGKHASTGSQTVSYPGGIGANDFLLLIIETDNADSSGTLSGWDKFITQSGAGVSNKVYVYSRFKGSSTNVYVPDVGSQQCASVLAFRNVSLSNPVHMYTSAQVLSNKENSTISGITTTNNKCYVLYGMAHDANSSSAVMGSYSGTSLSGGAELIDISTGLGWHGGYACWGGTKEIAGSTGTLSLTNSFGAWNQASFVIALNAGP